MNKLRRTLGVVWAVSLLMLALAAPAAMAQSGQDGYVPPGPEVIDDTNQSDSSDDSQELGSPSSTDPDDSGSGGELPFTGLDLGLVALAGGSLLVLGFGMRRLTRAA